MKEGEIWEETGRERGLGRKILHVAGTIKERGRKRRGNGKIMSVECIQGRRESYK